MTDGKGRVARAASKFCLRYQLFAYISFFILAIQLILAFNFYNFTESESQRIREQREALLKQDPAKNFVSNGDGAAQGFKAVPADKRKVPLKKASSLNYKDVMKNIDPKCHITSSEAVSAISRATSTECQQTIADLSCRQSNGDLYPLHIKSECPLRASNYGQYKGCFQDYHHKRLLPDHNTEFRTYNSPETCVAFCLRAGKAYAGVQFGFECWCGNNVTTVGKLSDSRCDSKCYGNGNQTCGGYLAVAVYSTGLGSKPSRHTRYVRSDEVPADAKKARIAFVLTVNGRALRQIKRLFKVLYHTDHYYLIHVDSRQEYLHRELSILTKDYDNVYVTPKRLSTIWGGASLLTMHLNCIKELLYKKDWKWDYFINLSESDFPIKSLEDLVNFMTRYNGYSFVKSHGNDTPKFIRKQGLDKTFSECDNHMWQLGTRPLPSGIILDGGSDWLGLHRDFCEYVVENDRLVTQMLSYWKYTLLPSESFFHTVLQNSKMCKTMINTNNLHTTNWIRSKGCKCQYKAIVDWCGCSPNNFLTEDLPKLLSHGEKPLYFARKFEAIINQDIINELDNMYFGAYPENTPGFTSYWQNEYHVDDVATKTKDEMLTMYDSFARHGTQQMKTKIGTSGCTFLLRKVLEVTVYSTDDQIQGHIVKFEAISFINKKNYTFETLMQPQRKFNILRPTPPIDRLIYLEVGTNFDPKEELFRNYGGIFGPYSEIGLGHAWQEGPKLITRVEWIDPTLRVAMSSELNVPKERTVEVLKPSLVLPMHPGIWTVKLMYLWNVVAEVQFLVTPLSYYGGRPITDGEAKLLHQGPPNSTYLANDDKKYGKVVLGIEDSLKAKQEAEKNAKRTGMELDDWIDDLSSEMWHTADTCISSTADTAPVCTHLSHCQKTSWSSLSPDPKSEFFPINPETGRIR